ncbi:hypothetical protein M426DRAFT_10560 [Hypoxylon sp. CI-4A]|nr:hypothetical protein M426DRAFT_10560 [Hypoxylon sp. CI-4A]
MKFPTIIFLFGLPGVAQAWRLDARQFIPSGNSSAPLSSVQSLSSQTEPAAPLLVATPTGITSPPDTPKQDRGSQDTDVSSSPGPTPEPALRTVTQSAEEVSAAEEIRDIPASISTAVVVETQVLTTTLAFPSPISSSSSSSSSLSTPPVSPISPISPAIEASTKKPPAKPTTIVSPTTESTNSPPVRTSTSSPSPTTLITSRTTSSTISSTPSSQPGTTLITISSSTPISLSTSQTTTMSTATPTPTPSSTSGNGDGNSTLTIALSTVLSVIAVLLIAAGAYMCTGSRRRRLPMFINRGITPIGDDEIATWKSNRSAEKITDRYTTRPHHSQNPSTATSTTTTRRAPSVIQYSSGGRAPSFEVASPRSFIGGGGGGGGGKYSFDLPQAPGAVLARAPNARSGLTDDCIPGDDPFLPSPRRHPSRLHKLPPNSPSVHGRVKGSRSSSLRSFAEAAWRDGAAGESVSSPRGSSDAAAAAAHSRSHNRYFSNSSILPPPPRLSFGDSEQLTGLSPPPSRRKDVETTIGLAVG